MKISKLYYIIKNIEISGESYISIKELLHYLSSDKTIEICDCIIEPYYVDCGRRLELYQYELMINRNESFKHYMQNNIRSKKYCDIPKDIKELRKKCYINLHDCKGTEAVDKVINYINFLLFDTELKNEVIRAVGSWNNENLYVAIYD